MQNIADFRLAGGVDGYLNVEGTVQPVEPTSPGAEAVRVNVKFTAFSLRIGALPALQIPLEWASPTVRCCCLPVICSLTQQNPSADRDEGTPESFSCLPNDQQVSLGPWVSCLLCGHRLDVHPQPAEAPV